MTPERFNRLCATLDKRQPDLTVLTDYVHKGRNLSAIVRTADAVGVGDVHCVIGDKDYHSFRGTALGSHRYVKVHRYRELQTPVGELKARGFQIVAAHLSRQAVDYHEVDFTKPTALLMGAEKDGISDEASALADIHVTVPMVGMVESFNVSVAAGIILSEARHQRQLAGLYDQQRIDTAEYDRLFFEWAHPKIRDFCRTHRFEYPALREDGEIIDASGWYADKREILAKRRQQKLEGDM
ncbi:MAG: tRNA (guanosine(18)-2'-O)-methyltransferase TrmH [Oceanicoccus sp.]|uniref:tRNA (guanosine(18)-2'-O)-methyltransferase TrmH n=1 Tax=Oceanicoccus sp. TaxID=2691044 RepID=UPI00262E823F|nr:tRNA (guanosine(18)-2'-O)-methyltransferase TrmH [Oceanicoccus sp.]MCP3907543.1 tRNA (guanosine(18)-2'-O)-methyltransferase TrmH [Oceanicoccus sp.]MDG1772235.1 tRNA (guanosine(18)-2'-O)-methyltransferase TrmH [Oceanicoccus sp.]